MENTLDVAARVHPNSLSKGLKKTPKGYYMALWAVMFHSAAAIITYP